MNRTLLIALVAWILFWAVIALAETVPGILTLNAKSPPLERIEIFKDFNGATKVCVEMQYEPEFPCTTVDDLREMGRR